MHPDKDAPFAGIDFSAFDVTKMLDGLKVPGVDWKALMDSQANNIKALSEANRRAVEELQAVAKRQMEIMHQAMTTAANVARQASAAGTQQQLARQSELAKQAFEQAIANMRELAETMQKSTHEAFDVVNRRISASLDELKDRMTPR